MQPINSALNNFPAVLVILLGLAFFLAFFLIKGLICYFTIQSLRVVPAQHRIIEPGMIWLLLIPCFGIVWNFFVFTRVPRSFEGYFRAHGRTDLGDCHRSLGLAYAVCEAVVLVPWLGAIAWVAAIVLVIIVLTKFNDLKREALALQSGGAPSPMVN